MPIEGTVGVASGGGVLSPMLGTVVAGNGCGVLGPFSMFSPQFSALSAWSSLGSGNYHAMQWSIRKEFRNDFMFDINYTLGKSIDLSSRSENQANFSSDFLINSWSTAWPAFAAMLRVSERLLRLMPRK